MQKLKDIDLVIASGSEKTQTCLQEMFSQQGANVVLCGFLDLNFVAQLEHNINADVILIDMDDSYEEDEDALDRLLEKIDLPILFHDNDFDELNDPKEGECFSGPAVEKLAGKLAELVDNSHIKAKSIDKDFVETEVELKDPVAELSEAQEEIPVLKNDSLGTVNTSSEKQFISASIESLTDINSLLKDEITGDKEALTVIKSSEEVLEELDLVESETVDNHIKNDSTTLDENSFDLVEDSLKMAEGSLKLVDDSSESIKGSSAFVEESKEQLVNVWVLGASIGGPEAVKRFLARIPKELPVAFVLAQHLGEGFVSLLANQMDRVSSFNVKEAVEGETLKHGEVIVVPVDNRMSLNDKGLVTFVEEDWKGHYKPSIDCVIDDVTGSFKKQSGVIIFSGMGADGVLASQKFAEKYNGNIWAQNTDTCVISSMPDSVRKANLVSYSGSPEALALKIAVHYMGKESYIT